MTAASACRCRAERCKANQPPPTMIASAASPTGIRIARRFRVRTGGALTSVGPGPWAVEAEVVAPSSDAMRATKAGDVSPPGRCVHCTSRNESGTSASRSRVESTTTGTMNDRSAAMRCERSTASFHSSRKYPSSRSWLCCEISGINNAQSWICLRIWRSQASPPRSLLWSSQTSIPPARSASQMRAAALASCEA
jgi:hypothetical protein